jgi:hypothetical protein
MGTVQKLVRQANYIGRPMFPFRRDYGWVPAPAGDPLEPASVQ